ncbi:uncharacterized protein LOC100264054 isoform X1 [Vitis vinifera]|uniref:uncharacterized protein LOC100264054 isoform X1 n=1 Tax=Vitis vinifera TaxID=29760 RepID=UPI00053FB67F|nr:uncharacterized protein LOC100264054 isoform X1 [Vitis vinifera]|eukprot:XP_010644130.1 PREDICTED: inner centromere protein isoform X3 [Vitis vinifera]
MCILWIIVRMLKNWFLQVGGSIIPMRRRLSVPECVPGTLLWPLFGYVVDCTHLQPSTMQSIFRVSVMKNVPPSLGFSSSFSRLHSLGALPMSINAGETLDSDECGESKLGADSSKKHTLNGVVQLDSYSNSGEIYINDHCKESQRRRKIGLANKGRVPWNKGRKHSAETREKIRQRTIQALRDPKVRQKMSECPRTHSEQSKAKIRSSLRRVWGKRLKWKRSREKFYLSWAESIAKAAKKGGSDQEELDWDSYDKIKEEIALQQLQWAENKKKAKELAKMRAERAARARAEKMAMLAEKRRERERQAEARGEIKRETTRKSKEDKEELAVAKGLKLKERLTKLHKKKSINGQVASLREMVISQIPACEKLDLEFIKRERMQREVSLADQIRAAKSKRAQSAMREALTELSPSYPSSARSS